MSWEAGITKESIDGSNSTSRCCCFRSLSLVRLLARRLVAASLIAHRSLLVALELLGVSLVCVALVWLVRHLFDWGFWGFGRHWRASLVSESSLDWKIDGIQYIQYSS